MSEETQRQRVRGAATVFSDFASVLGARFASALFALATVLLTTRILGPEGYGIYAYVSVLALLISTVTASWTNAAVTRYGREEFERRGSTAAVTWSRIRLTAPLLVIASLLIVATKVAGGFPLHISWPLTWLAIAYGVVLVSDDHIVYSLEAVGRMKRSAAQLITRQVLVIGALAAILVAGLGASPFVVGCIVAAGTALSAVGFGSSVWSVSLWPPRAEPELRRRMLRFSAPLIAFTVSQYVIRSIDLIVIGAFATAATVGVYAVAYQSYGVLQQLTTVSGPVLTPLFVSLRMAGREAVVDRYLERAVPQLMLIASTLAGVAVPFVHVAVPVVFGQSFAGASDPLTILLLAVLIGFNVNFLSPVIVLHERTGGVGIVNAVAAVVNIVGDVILVGPAGLHLIGPAIATAVTVAMVLVGYVLILRDTTSAHVTVSAIAFLPFIAGFIPAVTMPSAIAIPVGIVAAVLCAAAIMRWRAPFNREDVGLISQLDIPRPLKRLTVGILEAVAR
jgi:O-antigen/teichoic acid export membrane protein